MNTIYTIENYKDMAKYLLLYNDVDTFEDQQNSVDYVNSIVPGVGYVREDQGVRYNRKKGPVLKYTIGLGTGPFYEPSFGDIYQVSVDGVAVSSFPYTIAEEGVHTIEIELIDGTTDLFGEVYGAIDMYVPEGITYICDGLTGQGTGQGLSGKLYLPSTLQSMGSATGSSFGCYYGAMNEVTCLAAVAPDLLSPYEFNGTVSGTLYHPAGADYSAWLAKLGNGWTEATV